MDGAMTKAPRGGGKVGKNPTDRGKIGTKRRILTDGRGVPMVWPWTAQIGMISS